MKGLTVMVTSRVEGVGAGVERGRGGVRRVPAVRRAVCGREREVAARETETRLPLYRRYTEGMLRRYLRMSMECGRVPSLLGREMFRGRVTSYRIRSFEDVVIFVHDVETCLRRLQPAEWQLLERIALQEYTQGEAAELLGMSLRTLVRRYAAAVDRLSSIFLEAGLMERLWDGSEEVQAVEAEEPVRVKTRCRTMRRK